MKRHSVVLGYMFLGLILAAPAICAESMSMYFRQLRPSYQIIAALVDKLLENGYSEEDCGKFLGGNMYRVMKQFWV